MIIKVTGDKVNFIDENDVYVGYDLGQDCCEHADWFIHYKQCNSPYIEEEWGDSYSGLVHDDIDVNGFVFDPTFVENADADVDGGGMIIFRLVKGNNQLFLHLFNVHNGYYGHGFQTNLPCGNGCL